MRYRLLAPQQLPAGVVLTGLTPDQVRRRAHALQEAGTGRHRGTQPTNWKAGEVLEVDIDLPAHLAEPAEPAQPAEPVEPPPVARPRARRKA